MLQAPKEGPVGPKGDKGDTGDMGPPGSGETFVYTTPSASASWVIDHNLNKFPAAIRVENSAGDDVDGEVTYISANTLRIDFNAAFNGTAYIS